MSIEQSIPEFAPSVRRKQTREVLTIEQRAALRKMRRLNYLLAACSSVVVSRVMSALESEQEPEPRAIAAVNALKLEQTAGRDSDFVRACLGSLMHCDKKDILREIAEGRRVDDDYL